MAANLFIDRTKLKKKELSAINKFAKLNLDNNLNQEIEQFYTTLDKLLNSLTVEEKFLVDNIYYKDKKLVEIAEDLQVSHSTIRKRKQRLLEKLRKRLSSGINIKALLSSNTIFNCILFVRLWA